MEITLRSHTCIAKRKIASCLPTKPQLMFSSIIPNCDQDLFPSLENDLEYDERRHDFHAVGRSQGLEDLFDSAFVSDGLTAKDLYNAQCQYLFSVLSTKIKMTRGKALVCLQDITQ